jgi:hypothetical protein
MKIKQVGQTIFVAVFLAVYLVSLPANEPRDMNDQKVMGTPVGRFLMVVVPGAANERPEVYRFDTVTGKTWRMTKVAVADDKDEPTEGFFEGWVEVDENPGQKALEWHAQKKDNPSQLGSDTKNQSIQGAEPSTAVTPPASASDVLRRDEDAGDRASGTRGSPDR